MYEESGYHDPNPAPSLLDGILPHDATSINSTSNNIMDQENLWISGFSLENLEHPNNDATTMGAAGLENLQHHLGFEIEHELHNHLMQADVPIPIDNPTWDPKAHQGLSQPYYPAAADEPQQHHQNIALQQNFQRYDTTPLPYTDTTYAVSAAAPDLLNLLHLPRCTVAAPPVLPLQHAAGLLPTDMSFNSPSRRTNSCFLDIYGNELPTVDDGSMLQMGYPPPPQSHLLRDLFHSLPQNYGLYCGVDDREGGGVGGGGGGSGIFQEENGRFESPVFDFRRDVKGEKGNFATEKQRRQQMNSKYDVLKSLIPNLSKTDRASVVMGAIDYIHELQRTVSELKLLIEKKKHGRNYKRLKTEDDATVVTAAAAADVESSSMRPIGGNEHEFAFNDTLRSSWLQRKSRETFVDVRIVDDEVNVKVTQKKKVDCLLVASKALDELQLDIIHVSAGFIGEHYIFLFNTKIFDGSSVYASAIAKKMLEVMDRPYIPYPSSSGF